MAREPFNPSLIKAPKREAAPAQSGHITVSAVTAMVKNAIDTALPSTVHVMGEISNFKRHSSGHLYLTLKDAASELSCVMWRSQAERLKFDPADGLQVIATGRVEVFERAGRYQLYIRKLEPRGVGSLELAFRQVCEKLEAEGLFEERHKKPLPEHPARVAIVTSPTGAAIADMLRTIQRRYPCVDVLVYPVAVQGDAAKSQIAAAIDSVNAHADQLGGVDLMIIGRGGGSIEDLWAFNEEVVARAIHASRIPIISAVGHEVDVTVADLVADVRAATPTAAAELAVPVRDDLIEGVAELALRCRRAVSSRMELNRTHFAGLTRRRALAEPLSAVYQREQTVDEVANRMQRSWSARLHDTRLRLDRLEAIVQRIAPHAQLMRTAVVIRDTEHRLQWAITRRLADVAGRTALARTRLDTAAPARRLPLLISKVGRARQTLVSATEHRMSLGVEHIGGLEQRLAAMGYKSILNRGFSITRTKRGKQVVRSTDQLADCQRLVTELADGTVESEVINLSQLELFE